VNWRSLLLLNSNIWGNLQAEVIALLNGSKDTPYGFIPDTGNQYKVKTNPGVIQNYRMPSTWNWAMDSLAII
jgi:hypothetical protein